ncbi:MAG: hypothetical protein UY48_C0049G0003 [Candidatus Gottesmanbacteria bacterium GW2011_GWB1_49_7]|uniref:Uncharacterized protein n=1 Tax=Candidatus Gottesmanbacteria bacterium GW2011_GWB1_49_7 TaxID=1618448 RepID=A0A0G1VUP8_9BACT|nr:MAG: hypothetical protein UY48_C0049G0003 [Candidatus Gottesmanbacteria bacterium GW2011_GWB1_49_7]
MKDTKKKSRESRTERNRAARLRFWAPYKEKIA